MQPTTHSLAKLLLLCEDLPVTVVDQHGIEHPLTDDGPKVERQGGGSAPDYYVINVLTNAKVQP